MTRTGANIRINKLIPRAPKEGPKNLLDAAPNLLKAAELAKVALTDLCNAHGSTTEARIALAELIQAIAYAKGEL